MKTIKSTKNEALEVIIDLPVVRKTNTTES